LYHHISGEIYSGLPLPYLAIWGGKKNQKNGSSHSASSVFCTTPTTEPTLLPENTPFFSTQFNILRWKKKTENGEKRNLRN
ncbi:hypothetical protein PJI17_32295, partial [Mycobacterium kansasii]